MAVALILGFFVLLNLAMALASVTSLGAASIMTYLVIFAIGGGAIVAMAKLLEDADAEAGGH